MIQTIFKKTIAVVLFMFTVTVFANPSDYLPENAQIYGSVNLSQILKIPELQKYMPEINNGMQGSGLQVKDLDGVVAFAVDMEKNENSVIANLTVAFEFAQPVAAQIFSKLKQGDATLKSTIVDGKQALLIKEDEARFILYNNNVVILQGHLEGRKPFLALNGSTTFKGDAHALLQNHVALVADATSILSIAKDEMFSAEDAEMAALFSKIKLALAVLNYNNNRIIGNVVFECNTKDDAEALVELAKIIINSIIDEKPALKPVLSTLYPVLQNKYVVFKVNVSISDIEKFMK